MVWSKQTEMRLCQIFESSSKISSIMANTVQDEQKNSADESVKSEKVHISEENTKLQVAQEENQTQENKNVDKVSNTDKIEEISEPNVEMENEAPADAPTESKAQADAQDESNNEISNNVEENNADEKADDKVIQQIDQGVEFSPDKTNQEEDICENEPSNDNGNDDNKDAENDEDEYNGEEEEEEGDGGENCNDNDEDDDEDDEDDDVDDGDNVIDEIEQDGENKNHGDTKEDDIEEEDEEQEPEHKPETKAEKQLDHDQDRRNPQYIPKGGAFYEHDNRTSSEDVKSKDTQDADKKKKVWKESKKSERWSHDCYNEFEQQPKTKAEIMETYGYDIRNEEAPPRARRRRKYGRGPDKYDRNWEDEQAYMVKQNMVGRRNKKKSFGKEEFPPLPNQKNESHAEKPSSKSQDWKKEEDSVKRSGKVSNHEKFSGSSQSNRNEYSSNRYGNGSGGGNHSVNSNRKNYSQSKKINKEDVKPYRQYDKTKWKNNNFRRGKFEDGYKTNKLKQANQEESQTPRSLESNKSYSGDSDIAHVTEGFSQMGFPAKHSNIRENRQETNEINEQEMDSSANRLNPKRYSKNRKGFTGFFPPEEIAEIDPLEMKQLQQEQQQKSQHVSLQQQPLNIQNIIRRYPGTYNGNPGYIAPRPIITGIPQQGMSPQGLQQALSPQGIPQQALSPQVPGLQTIELQQSPIPQTNFVPQIYMDPHYRASEIMGTYTGFTPYSANQPSEMYQPSGGITYYNTECQNTNQFRAPPARRQKTAIPILPPPK